MAQDLVKAGQWGAIYDRAPQSALCRQWTRDEYIARMEQVVAFETDYRAGQDAARAAREAAKAEAASASQAQGKADAEKKRREQEALAYVTSYAGTWGLPLDIRADRRWGTKYMRLSDRQVEALLEGKARDATRAEQAEIAREIAAADAYTASVTNAALRPSTAPVRRAPSQDGMYRASDGTIYKVQQAVHGSGRLYAKRLDVTSRSFVYEAGAIFRLTDDDRMSLEQAAEFGRLYGFCVKCGATLTDEASIARGIGPVCAGWRRWDCRRIASSATRDRSRSRALSSVGGWGVSTTLLRCATGPESRSGPVVLLAINASGRRATAQVCRAERGRSARP